MVEEEAAATVAAKIDSMQKFVPFLSKLISRLEQEDPQNEAKVVQMQLLYKILINTENSVSIEELNKCEEALEAIYKIYETPAMPAAAATGEEEQNKKTVEKKETNQEKDSIENKDKELEESAEKENEPLPKLDDKVKGKVHLEIAKEKQTTKIVKELNAENEQETEEGSTSEKKEESEECKEADQIIDDEIQLLIGRENVDKSNKNVSEKSAKDENVRQGKKQEANELKGKQKLELDAESKAVENNEKVKVNERKKEIESHADEETKKNEDDESVKDDDIKEPQNKETVKKDQQELSKENNNKDEESEAEENENDVKDESEFDEEEEVDEENVEMIRMPEEADAEEMILPDSADEDEQERGNKSSQEEDTDDEVNKEDTDDEVTKEDAKDIKDAKNKKDIKDAKNKKGTKDKEDNKIIKKYQQDQQDNVKKDEQEKNRKDTEVQHERNAGKEVQEELQKKQEKEDLLVESVSNNNKQSSTKNISSTSKNSKTAAAEPTSSTTHEEEETAEEPELVAMLEEPTGQVDEDDDDGIERSNFGGYDPLTCEETNEKAKEQEDDDGDNDTNEKTGAGAKKNNGEPVLQIDDDEDDDDDDVELIETRNSPICLDSDDDEAAATTTKKLSTTSAKPQERTFARKSTAKPTAVPATVPQIQKKSKNMSYLDNVQIGRPQRRRVVDTIDLLDSSDDEASSSSRTQRNKRARVNTVAPATTQSSPAKRQLLSALKKNTNKKTQPRTQPPPQLLKRAAAAAAAHHTPRPVHLSTPQSNFLNAVQLQPAFAGANPAAFSTQLSNKNVIIPNAFYGNPTRSQTLAPAAWPAAQRGRPRLTPKPLPTFAVDQQCGDRVFRRWLENFLTHFAHPQHIASHSCFVLLQRVLKYKSFTRIKETRTHLNTLASSAAEFIDIQLMLDLREIFYTSPTQLSDVGRSFCQLASSTASGVKPITLTTEARSGRVSSRTRTGVTLAGGNGSNGAAAPNFSGIFSAATSGDTSPGLTAGARKRQRDDVEYKPDKAHALAIIESNDGGGGDSSGGERKRTLRTNRTRRHDNSFSYNEDEDPNEFEDEDEDEEAVQESAESRAAKEAVQRIVEQKRLEAQRQRERQAKSFENAFISAFAANGCLAEDNVPTSSKAKKQPRTSGILPTIVNEASGSSGEAAASVFLIHDAPDNDRDEAYSLEQFDEEPIQHRIYKVIPAKLTAAASCSSGNKRKQTPQLKPAQQSPKQNKLMKKRGRPSKKAKAASTEDEEEEYEDAAEEAEIITCDDLDDDEPVAATTSTSNVNAENSNDASNDCVVLSQHDAACVDIDPAAAPRNTDRTMCARSKNNEWCVICNFRTPRIVHHYVNLHRGCEVYTARLLERQVKRLRRPNGADAQLHKYKNGQQQYEAQCPFCEKTSRFMLPYWYQHFTMHTGEYAYRCTACGIRKPTRSLLVAHINQPCSVASANRNVAGVVQDFTFDARAAQIEARICMLCNYVQLQRANVVAHLKLQHGIKQILPKHIQSIVLLKTPVVGQNVAAATAQSYKVRTTTAVRGSGGAVYEIEEIEDDEDGLAPPDDGSASVGDNMFFNYDAESPAPAAAGNWNEYDAADDDADPSDDLSFMICGMLDVQMNTD